MAFVKNQYKYPGLTLHNIIYVRLGGNGTMLEPSSAASRKELTFQSMAYRSKKHKPKRMLVPANIGFGG